jgi:hypothetical protein
MTSSVPVILCAESAKISHPSVATARATLACLVLRRFSTLPSNHPWSARLLRPFPLAPTRRSTRPRPGHPASPRLLHRQEMDPDGGRRMSGETRRVGILRGRGRLAVGRWTMSQTLSAADRILLLRCLMPTRLRG